MQIKYFYTQWCWPCHTQSPIIDELMKEYEWKIEKVDCWTAEWIELASKYNIQSTPSFLITRKIEWSKEWEVFEEIISWMRSKQALIELIEWVD